MNSLGRAFCCLAALASGPEGARAAQEPPPLPEAERIAFFERRIRPVLADRCYGCHSARASKVKGGLSLDSREGLLKGGASGPALVPGDPHRSRLIRAIRHEDEGLRMPPKEKLPENEIADLVAWVRMGAPDPRTKAAPTDASEDLLSRARRFWSFQPVQDPPLPRVKLKDWAANALDLFILARLEEAGLRPSPPADRRTLLRRATFDLIGLPPTPEEIEAFLADDAPDAFERLVERLLASPHYGERWGRHWLDVVRYADTAGENSDFPVPSAWRYRNYVIRSFNRDKGYARFLQEQIAGDLMESSTEEERTDRIVATGYLAGALRFGTLLIDGAPHLVIEDTLENLGRTVLGLGLSCARCHDHKFDPITSEDYYALYGFLASTRYPFPGNEERPYARDLVPLMTRERFATLFEPLQAELAALDAEVARIAARHGVPEQVDTVKELVEARNRREAFAKSLPREDWAYAVAEGTPQNARIQIGGNPKKPGPEVSRRFLRALGGQALPPQTQGSGRLHLARWLTDPANPLTARVMVNRIWLHHFGRGIVGTPNDFGKQGLPPTHPELLDYLASAFVRGGGSVKAMHRLVMRSAAYRQSSADDPRHASIDPDNLLLWRFPRRRLEAEAIRDAVLAVSGSLDRSMGGPHPFPPEATWKFSQHEPFAAVYETRRRSVYLMTQRLRKHPFLEIFDGAETTAGTPQRSRSVTALQALFFLNGRFVQDGAARLAARLLEARPGDPERVELAYLLLFGRPPDPEERAAGRAYLARFGKGSARAAWESYARALLRTGEFVTVD